MAKKVTYVSVSNGGSAIGKLKRLHDLELLRCICAHVHNRHTARSYIMIFIKLFYKCQLDNYRGC